MNKQPKKQRNITSIKMIIENRKINQIFEYQSQIKDKAYNFRKFNRKTQRKDKFQVKQDQNEFLERNSTISLFYYYYFH
jgi:hypothetical protein